VAIRFIVLFHLFGQMATIISDVYDYVISKTVPEHISVIVWNHMVQINSTKNKQDTKREINTDVVQNIHIYSISLK